MDTGNNNNSAAANNTWSDSQEQILKEFAEKSMCYRYINYECYTHYKGVDYRFSLPVIILSTLAGSASLGSGNLPEYAEYITICSAIINIITGILGTLQRFLNTAELTSQHFTSSVEYGRLSRSIGVMLSLPRCDRPQEGHKFLDACKSEYDRLVDQTAAPPRFILKRFEKKYKNLCIVKPDLVSLTPVSVNKTVRKYVALNSTHKATDSGANAQKFQHERELQSLRDNKLVRSGSLVMQKHPLPNNAETDVESVFSVVSDGSSHGSH